MLFLHGYLSSSDSFAYQLPFFSKDFRVFAPDLKGFGKNQGMSFPYSLDDYVEEVKEYIEKNNLGTPHVIAHSFGGRIVLKACTKYNLFDKIVLTGGAGLRPKTTVKKFIKRKTFLFLKNFLPSQKLKRFYSSDYLALDGVMRESFKKIVSENLDYTLPCVKNKTLLIYGKKDRETPLYMAKRLKNGIENSTLSIYKDAGHFCFIDKPLRFNMEVREFLLSQ